MSAEWIEIYYKLILEGNSEDKLEEATIIKTENVPHRLFKYLKVDEYLIENLKKNKLCLTHPSLLNDPWEARFSIDQKKLKIIDPSRMSDETRQLFGHEETIGMLCEKTPSSRYKELHSIVLDRLNQSKLRDWCDDHMKNFFVGAFTCTNSNNLMWSHYADSHQGVCLEYDMSKLKEVWGRVIDLLYPVRYSKKLFDLTEYFQASQRDEELSFLNLHIPMLTKDKCWSYEREWRIVLNPDFKFEELPNIICNLNNGRMLIDMPEPKAVYLGERFDKTSDFGKELMEICKNREIEVYYMESDVNSYQMVPTISTSVSLNLNNSEISIDN